MVTEIDPLEYPDQISWDFRLYSWMKSEVYWRKLDTRKELHARILDASARVKKREDELRRTIRDLRTRDESALRLTVGFSNILCGQ